MISRFRTEVVNYNDGTKHELTGDSLQSMADQYVALRQAGFDLATEKIDDGCGKIVGWIWPTPFGADWSHA